MSDKLEALKAVERFDAEIEMHGGESFAVWSPAPSGSHVSAKDYDALLAALEEKDQELDKEGDILIDTQESMREWKQRANAAEQREEHLKATVDVLSANNAELEQRLQQPIKLPNKNDDEFWFGSTFQVARFDRAVERAIIAAGFKFKGE